MAHAQPPLHRVRESASYYLGGIYRQVSDKQVFLWAQAVAFKVLVTIVPVIVLAVAILGQVLRREDAFQTVARFIGGFLPPYRTRDVIDVLESLQGASNVITIIGVAGLLFSAMTLFTTLRIVVSNVFQEEWHETRTILGGYAFDVRMAAQVGLLFILTFALSLGMNTLNSAGGALLVDWGLDYNWVQTWWGRMFALFGLVLPFVLSIGMFWQLFFFIPKPHPPKRSALVGAAVTALLWELAKFGFTFYATTIGRFERYRTGGAGDATTAILGNTFGLIIAFVFWIYFSGVVLCMGGIVALLHEKRHRARRRRQRLAELGGDGGAPPNTPERARTAEDVSAS